MQAFIPLTTAHQQPPFFVLKPLRRGILMAFLAIAAPVNILAATPAQVETQQQIQAFTITAGSMESALAAFSAQSGVNVSFTPEVVQGKNTAGLTGRYQIDEALNRILEGSGLTLRFTGERTVTIEQSKPSQVITLPAVTVSATGMGDITEGSGSYTVHSVSSSTRLNLVPKETPQSVSVVTRSIIEDFSLTNVNDMLASVTGVNVELVESDRTYFSIRGFEVSNFLIDGIGLPFATGDQLGDIDTALYDHVEVLRGANGLLASTGNPAGTVNFVRKRPTRELQASTAVTLGSWQNRRVDGDVSSALDSEGRWRGRLIVAAQDKNSHLDHYSLEKKLFSTIIEHDLGTDTLLVVGHSQQSNRPKGTLWGALPLEYSDGTPTSYARSASSAAKWSYWNSDDTQTFVELGHHLDADWRLKTTLLRRSLKSDGELFYVYGTPNRETGTGLFSWPSKYNHVERQWMFDTSLTGIINIGEHEHELVFGASHSKSDNWLQSRDDDTDLPLTESEMLSGNFPRPVFDAEVSGYADFINRRNSLYTAARFSLATDLKLLAGANLSRVTSSGVQYSAVHSYSKARTTPYFGIVYNLDRYHTTYASYAEIFNPQHQISQSGNVLDPIEGRNLEVGLKGEWFDQQLNGSLALFSTEQKNTAEYDGFADGRSY